MTPVHSSPPADVPQLGLRERKKIKTRTAIRDATYALIEEGPYRLSRNPLYVGLLALYLGLALLATTFWGLVLFPVAVLLVLWGAILPEERFLHERFGAPYDDYTRRVRRWL